MRVRLSYVMPWIHSIFASQKYNVQFMLINSLACSALSKFVNKAADGGITALHMAALNGYFDCVQLLLDIHANISAVTFHYGTTMDMIGRC